MSAFRTPLLAFAALVLGACSETTGDGGGSPPPSSDALRTGSPADEQACLNAVAAQTNNSVTVMSSEFSQANTLVMIGVGPELAPWRCLVSGGVVAEVSFTGSEGAL